MIRVRTFLLDPVGVPQPCSQARFERLWDADPRETLPAHAGRVAQFADVFVLVEDGLPRSVVRTDCLQLRVTRDGVLDQREKQRLMSLGEYQGRH
jgi:hypothetical protein